MIDTANNFIFKFADAIERDVSLIKVEDRFRDYEEWDSIALLSLVAMLDDNYSVNIPREIFEKIETIQDLIDQLNNY
jgi:acyl carrier protein